MSEPPKIDLPELDKLTDDPELTPEQNRENQKARMAIMVLYLKLQKIKTMCMSDRDEAATIRAHSDRLISELEEKIVKLNKNGL